jgi:uncharacterized protein (DUF983 family)
VPDGVSPVTQIKRKVCLRCGWDMTDSWWNECPACGKKFAFYTDRQRRTLFAVGIVVAIVVNGLLVVLLWNFA